MPPSLPTDSAKIVKAARTHLKLSQVDFAKKINKSQTVVSKYESGTVHPPGDIIIHCMNILGDRSYAILPAPKSDHLWAAVVQAMAQLDAALDAFHKPREGIGD